MIGPCDWTMVVEHIVLGFFAMCSAAFSAYLVHGQRRADRERRELNCEWCRAHHSRYRHVHEKDGGPIGPDGL